MSLGIVVAATAGFIFACGDKSHPPVIGSGPIGHDAGPLCNAAPAPTGLIGASSTIVGKVFDPAGFNPLYNVSVYIPQGSTLPPLSKGVSCDRCGSTALNPVASALTDESGSFTLTNVPMGTYQIVVQVGKWRRVTSLDVSDSCVDAGQLRLPKNGTEGDMPQIAVTTGALDALECLIRDMGVDEAEFVPGAGGTGHVHMFNGFGGHGVTGSPDAQAELWNDATKMSAYDIVALSCEGAEHNEEKTNMQAMHDYAQAGGRIFGTHFHYTWFKNSPQPDFQSVATWDDTVSQLPDAGDFYNVNETFPKGKSFAKWLVLSDATKVEGELELSNVTSSISSVNTKTSEDWVDISHEDVKILHLQHARYEARPRSNVAASSSVTFTYFRRAVKCGPPAAARTMGFLRSRRRWSSCSSICHRAFRRTPRRLRP